MAATNNAWLATKWCCLICCQRLLREGRTGWHPGVMQGALSLAADACHLYATQLVCSSGTWLMHCTVLCRPHQRSKGTPPQLQAPACGSSCWRHASGSVAAAAAAISAAGLATAGTGSGAAARAEAGTHAAAPGQGLRAADAAFKPGSPCGAGRPRGRASKSAAGSAVHADAAAGDRQEVCSPQVQSC